MLSCWSVLMGKNFPLISSLNLSFQLVLIVTHPFSTDNRLCKETRLHLTDYLFVGTGKLL